MSENEEKEKEKYYEEEYKEPVPCDFGCGGLMTWCSICNCWSHTCCVDYGTCMCS